MWRLGLGLLAMAAICLADRGHAAEEPNKTVCPAPAVKLELRPEAVQRGPPILLSAQVAAIHQPTQEAELARLAVVEALDQQHEPPMHRLGQGGGHFE